MKANETKLIRFLEGHDKKFVIPVYQRNYDWKKENCKQLFDDLEDVVSSKRKSHFFGSIVYLDNEDAEQGREFIIIDGQQRITTLTLLMLALVHEYSEDEPNKEMINMIKNEYLVGKYNQKEKIKLKPIKDDNAAFEALFKNNPDNFSTSTITNNYLYFQERLKKSRMTLPEVFSAIKTLDIVDIKLKPSEDDPQLIFESLNSTGLDLSEADKVRNFILMRENGKKQEEYYNKYWNEIEKLTKYNVSNFIRDFLTLKERNTPNKNKVYFAFKEYRQSKKNLDTESILEELLKFAKYYNSIIKSHHDSAAIREILGYLNEIDMTVAYPFLLELFDDHENKIIDNRRLYDILLIIESFIVRRVVCDVPTNALNKIFMTLGRDIRTFDDYEENYLEILKYILSQKKGGQRFPENEELKEKMLTKDIYHTNSKNKLHLLTRLENFNNREKVDLQKLINEGQLSTEHIMPQTLSNVWKNELGNNYELVHSKYLHTIGNLTFTAYNSEMSNKPFEEKKKITRGFNESKLFLNTFVRNQEQWNEKTICERANILIERTLKIWPSSKTDYEDARNADNIYSLDDDYTFTGKKIKYFQFIGEKVSVEAWIDFYKKVLLMLLDLEATKFKQLLLDESYGGSTILISEKKSDPRKPLEISKGIYIEGNLSTESILASVRTALNKLEIDLSEISICLKEQD